MSNSSEPNDTAVAELMARYEITRVPAYQFHYKNYRYSRLTDAIAQAKRDAPLS